MSYFGDKSTYFGNPTYPQFRKKKKEESEEVEEEPKEEEENERTI